MFMHLVAEVTHLWIALQNNKVYAGLSDVPSMI